MPLTQWSPSIVIAELADEPALSEDFDALLRDFESQADDLPDVVLDMQAVTRFTSSNIGQLVRLRQLMDTRGRRLRICAVHPTVRSALHVTRLDTMFQFNDDVSTALASLHIE
jgi:anti-anti-sigma factor